MEGIEKLSQLLADTMNNYFVNSHAEFMWNTMGNTQHQFLSLVIICEPRILADLKQQIEKIEGFQASRADSFEIALNEGVKVASLICYHATFTIGASAASANVEGGANAWGDDDIDLS